MTYKRFDKIFTKKFSITINKCFEKFQNSILLIPSCRENDEIYETRMGEIQNDSYNNWLGRYKLSPTFSFSSKTFKRFKRF